MSSVKRPFRLKDSMNRGPLSTPSRWQRNPARQVDAAGREDLHGQISRLTCQNRNEHFDRGCTQLARMAWVKRGIADDWRGIFRGSNQPRDFRVLRDPFDLAEVFINVGNPDSGTDTFDTYMIEAFKQIFEQADLSLIGRCKI